VGTESPSPRRLAQFKYVHVDSEEPPAWYTSHVCPGGHLPVITDAGVRLTDASVFLEWLEDRFPQRGISLFPGSPAARAQIRSLVNSINLRSSFQHVVQNVADTAAAAEAELYALEGLYMSSRGDARGGPFFFAQDEPCAADISLVPFLHRLEMLGFPLDRWIMLSTALRAMWLRPAWQRTCPPTEVLEDAVASHRATLRLP
jgi:glutathione S-transferase